jgi:hypothetical protein
MISEFHRLGLFNADSRAQSAPQSAQLPAASRTRFAQRSLAVVCHATNEVVVVRFVDVNGSPLRR